MKILKLFWWSRRKEKNETELKCTVDKVEESNYTLNCKLKPNFKYEFDNSILYDNKFY